MIPATKMDPERPHAEPDRGRVTWQAVTDARRGASFGRAFLLGGAVALACGIGYALVAALTHHQFALITIGIGWVVGRSVQRSAQGLGGRRYQVLAVALTYFASSMGYLPAVVGAVAQAAGYADQDAVATASTAAPRLLPAPSATGTPLPPSTPPSERAEEPPLPEGSALAASLVFAVAITAFLTLAGPFIDISSGLGGVVGLLIVLLGLRTAWRAAKGGLAAGVVLPSESA